MDRESIKIKHNNYILTLEKNNLTDEGWTDVIIQNIKTGICTNGGINDDDIYSVLRILFNKGLLERIEE